jgi:hypothetical protein
MDTTTLDEIKNKYYGKIGESNRDRFENELKSLRENLRCHNSKTSSKD